MPDTVRVWVEESHHAAFNCGGWAFVRQDAGGLSGFAGGERSLSAERTALAGLAASLQGLPAKRSITIASTNPIIVGVLRRLHGLASGADTPHENADLWAQLAREVQDHAATFVTAEKAPKTPTAFAAAWAELARDKAKATGTFKAAIPKTNLAKAGV